MKKIALSVLIISGLLLSCKKNIETQDNSVAQTEIQVTEEVDTVAIKENLEKEKEALTKPYNEEEDAQAKIDELVKKAKKENKYVFIQAGGNWCIWCLRFNDFVQNDEELKSIVDENFEYYHLNYSQKNKNKEVFSKYIESTNGLGYPFFFVLNEDGDMINLITSSDLEEGKSYDIDKVKAMFLENSPKN